MYYKHLNGFSRAPGNGKSCWSVGDTKISFLNTLAENGPYMSRGGGGGGGGGHSTFKWSGVPAAGGWKPDPVLNRSAHEKYTLS